MKYIVQAIINEISGYNPTKDHETMVKIDGFEDLYLYYQIANELSKYFKNKNLTIKIKLAKSKWDEFEKNVTNTTVRNAMLNNQWVSNQQSVTYYRNLHDTDILILLGTENEEDADGLANCSTINPSLLARKLSSDYSQVYTSICSNWDKNERAIIHKLYKFLFEFKSVDICKLSDLADQRENVINSFEKAVDFFFDDLPKWGLPRRATHEKIGKSKKNILRPEYKFISRSDFKNVTNAKYKKFEKLISDYNENGGTYSQDWSGWEDQSLKSYEEFSKALLEFIRGENIQKNRNIFLNFDFNIVSDVLGYKKTSDTKSSKSSNEVILGEPLYAFMQMLLKTLASITHEDDVAMIEVDFHQAEIAINPLTDSKEDQKAALRDIWQDICRYTNGIFEYINSKAWSVNDNLIDITYTPENFFSPMLMSEFLETKVKAASLQKSISKIEFEVHCRDMSGNEIKSLKKKYEWKFSDNDLWIYDFSSICRTNLADSDGSTMIPLATVDHINHLTYCKSKDEFAEVLKNKSFDFLFDINEFITIKHSEETPDKIKAGFIALATAFGKFVYDLSQNGLYNIINSTQSSINKLVKAYCELGEKLTSTPLNENQRFILDGFINAFDIVEKVDVVRNGVTLKSCIVPAWHPATLQKISNQKIFFMDGCQEWWDSIKDRQNVSKVNIEDKINELKEICQIRNSVDVFPGRSLECFGNIISFGGFSIYASSDEKNEANVRDILKKDAVFDDDFSNKDLSQMTDDASLIYDVLNDYRKSFSTTYNNLNLVFLNPSDLQPIVASVYKFVKDLKNEHPHTILNITIKILVKPENKGGRNYLSYWMNEFFQENDNINVKTYLNEWDSVQKLREILDNNNDIIFMMNLLSENTLRFSHDNDSDRKISNNECYFPITFKPLAISNTSDKNRKIEISQPQFTASYIHTQAVFYRTHFEDVPTKKYIAIKEVEIDKAVQDILNDLHDKCYWVVCVDSGIDTALLRNSSSNVKYPIIGFSTGKGAYGQYNVTITSRDSILMSIEKKFSKRLEQMFHWKKDLIDKATNICIKEASGLDGISLFSAINSNDYNINEFMAYVLTSLREKEHNDSPLKVIIHLDSYKHWFRNAVNDDMSDSLSRPDFLIIEVDNSLDDDRLKLNATVVECKISSINNIQEHRIKAQKQLEHGLDVLSSIFDPNSNSVKRRYWYTQLYRALVFAQVSFEDSSQNFRILSSKLRAILTGDFEIKWKGEMLGYWLDYDEDLEVSNQVDNELITLIDIPQRRIQSILLGNENNEDVQFVKISEETISRDELEKMNREKRIEEIQEEKERINNHFAIDFEFSNDETMANGNEDNTRSNGEIENDQSSTNLSLEEAADAVKTNEIELKENDLNDQQPVADGNKSNPEIANDAHSESELLEELDNIDNLLDNVNSDDVDLSNIDAKENKMDSSDSDEPENEITKTKLEDIRIWIGKDSYNKDVYWDFGNKGLNNRHLLITGTSGQGKTYAIQTLLYELMKTNISAVAFDYTEGFRSEQLAPEFVSSLDNKFNQIVAYIHGVPINPFRRHEIVVMGQVGKEKESDVANRIASIFQHVYKFGDQQRSVIYRAVRDACKKYGDAMDMEHFRQELMEMQENDKISKGVIGKVISRIEAFFDAVKFEEDPNFSWEQLLYNEHSVFNVFQLTMIDREMQVIITELLLWDAYYYVLKNGNEKKPFVVILDEAQNLNHKKDSPTARILTEGRKFGWSAWFATQSLNVLNDDEITRLCQAGFHLYFKPSNDEITKTSKLIDPTDNARWVDKLKNLHKGQCIVQGDRIKLNGQFGAMEPSVTNVASFKMREEKENG